MIRRIQALNYRCLRYVDVSLDRFHVLIGPNASGKSTLFDAIAFLGDLVRDGLERAVGNRTSNFQDLVWGRPERDMGFELAIELEVPEALRDRLPAGKDFRVFRYEVEIREDDRGMRIASERGLLMPLRKHRPSAQRKLFPDPPTPPSTILIGGGRRGRRTILSKSAQGTDNFSVETETKAGKGWATQIAFGPHRSTLGNLPESPEKFPMATFVKRKLENGVKPVFLDSVAMRRASPPEFGTNGFADDGTNLPWVIKRLQDHHPADFKEWLSHVQTVLSDLRDIRVIDRPEDRHAYLLLRYDTGVDVPSWMASDGTMRLMALTLLAYLPDNREIYLLEEPENGVHPLAVEGICDSLSSAYDAQVLVTTHSPTLLALVEPPEVLCFEKNEDGATDIVPGRDGGCRADAANFLRQFLGTHHYSLVVFDRHGCGSTSSRQEIEGVVESDLAANGWDKRARTVVIDPELEAWVWSGSSAVSAALGWGPNHSQLKTWLTRQGLWADGSSKPENPKATMNKALESAVRKPRQRRSARIFGEIAQRVRLSGCQDPAFHKLATTLREWFAKAGP